VTCVEDVLEALGTIQAQTEPLAQAVPELGPDESTVWRALQAQPRHIDDLARSLGLGPGTVSATLTMLELKGMARQVGSMLYTRA
jgi:DNA processing protein